MPEALLAPDRFNKSSQWINALLEYAVKNEASDVHLEPEISNYRVRVRQDGIMHLVQKVPVEYACKIISCIKVMAQLDITEKRIPQDGSFTQSFASAVKVDCRIHCCPTTFGEKLNIRLLYFQKQPITLANIGFNCKQLESLYLALKEPQGIILVTGPTGSGKSTTLHSALAYLNQVDKNIITIEDPVENKHAGINQINVNSAIGLTFATALRATLRQDPDIIMIGEIRDSETADIAFKAAQTGHLVLATLHTNNAVHTLVRLQDLGISIPQIQACLHSIIAQRLIRKLCTFCKNKPTTETACNKCHMGYNQRTAIFETMFLSHTNTSPSIDMQTLAQQYQTISFAQTAQSILKQGLTDIAEITRVLGSHSFELKH